MSGTKLTDAERQQIADLCLAGKSCSEIAAIVGRSKSTISTLAKAVGHTFGQTNLANAVKARSAYSAEHRANLATLALERAITILATFDAQQVHVDSTGRKQMVPLDARGQKDRAQAIQLLNRTVLDIARQDEKPATEGQSQGLLERLVAGLESQAAQET